MPGFKIDDPVTNIKETWTHLIRIGYMYYYSWFFLFFLKTVYCVIRMCRPCSSMAGQLARPHIPQFHLRLSVTPSDWVLLSCNFDNTVFLIIHNVSTVTAIGKLNWTQYLHSHVVICFLGSLPKSRISISPGKVPEDHLFNLCWVCKWKIYCEKLFRLIQKDPNVNWLCHGGMVQCQC